MPIFDPNIGFNRPEVKYKDTFDLPVIDFSPLTKTLQGAVERENKSFDEIVKAYDEYSKNSRDVLGFRLDNDPQREDYKKVRGIYGVDDNTINNISTDDLKNPYKLKDIGKRLGQVTSDYRIKDIIKEQAVADTYRGQVEALKGIDPAMADLAVKDLDKYQKGQVKGTALNIKAYEPIDIVSEVAQEVKKIPEQTQSAMMRDLEDLGLVYEEANKHKSRNMIWMSLQSKLNDPVFKHNMIARGYYDPKTNTLTKEGDKFFNELANEHSAVSTTISSVTKIPGFDVDGTSGSSGKPTGSGGSKNPYNVDFRIFDGKGLNDDRGRLFQKHAEKIGLDTYDPDVVEKIKAVNAEYDASGDGNSPEKALKEGQNKLLKYALENAHVDWYATKAIRDFGYATDFDNFVKSVAEADDKNGLDKNIGEFLDKVYAQEAEKVNGAVEYLPDGKVKIKEYNTGLEVTIDHQKAFNNLKKKAKETADAWASNTEKIEKSDVVPSGDVTDRIANIESKSGAAVTNPDSTALGDYHFLWGTWKNKIIGFLKQKGLKEMSEEDAKKAFEKLNKEGQLTKYAKDKGWMATWVNNPTVQKEFMNQVADTDYDPFIKRILIPTFGNFLSDPKDYNYLVHFFGPQGAINYLKTGKHITGNGDQTALAKATLQAYDKTNGTTLWNDVADFFANKGKVINPEANAIQEELKQKEQSGLGVTDWGKIGD